jgi:pSer/pThr/pTyr-binding forkhead associated (FHA) protein
VSFFRRFFSADYRRALAAEAAGDYVEAARAYALAGETAKVGLMHLRRAERSTTRPEEVAALRDALEWGKDDPEIIRNASRALARVLATRLKAEGTATERDREMAREAARLYEAAGDFGDAGQLWESLGEDEPAARAYERGGLVDRMESALSRDERRERQRRRVKEAFEEYELHWKSGDREAAASALRVCVEAAEDKGEYRRLLDQLDSRRIASGRVGLRRLPSGGLAVVCGTKVTLGRDPLCELPLRAAGISRIHAEIIASGGGFALRDAGSKNGTLLGGLPVAGEVTLGDAGSFALGDDCEVGFEVAAGALRLEIARGLDKGVKVLLAPKPEARVDVEDVSGMPAVIWFDGGRPYLTAKSGKAIHLNKARVARGAIQLVREDVIAVDEVEVEVV